VKHGRKPNGGRGRAPSAPAAGGAAGGAAAAEEDEEDEEEEDPSVVAAAKASLERSLAPPAAVAAPAKRPHVRTCSVAELAVAYYLNTEGGGAAERLQRSGDAEARLASAASAPPAPASARTPAFAVAADRLTVRYKALRTVLEERVQALSRQETVELLRAVLARGGSGSRAGAAAHLLAAREMAARSPTAFWNAVRHFGSADAAAAEARGNAG
jgi:hypothetical protein